MNRETRTFSLTWVVVLITIAVIFVGAVAAYMSMRATTAEIAPAPGSVEAIAKELSKGQALEKAEITKDLGMAAETAHARMARTLEGLATAVPLEQADSPPLADTSDVDTWMRDLSVAATAFETVEEGTSDQSVAQEAFVGAAQLLLTAVQDYNRLSSSPAEDRNLLLVSVAERRDAAVRLWQAEAAQLDTLTIDSGGGHMHVFLAPDGDPDA
ncbi:MAG: hypothetical protein ABS909_04805, partial [Arthrobacter sp.]